MDVHVTITGHREGDIETALREVLRLVSEGYTSGMDSNDTGRYSFTLSGAPVKEYAIARHGDEKKLSAERFDCPDDAHEAAGKVDVVVGLDEHGDVLIHL